MPLVIARRIEKSYAANGKRVEVLRGAELQVEEGEFVTIFGASGSGKSTLLHILGGLDRPTGGEVIVHGVAVYAQRERELAAFRNRQIGFVFQFYHLLPELTAVENAMLPCLIGGMRSADARRRATQVMSEFGLAARLSHRPRELSGGEQQRVAIARALVQHPPLLLADEPTGNLDETSGRQVTAILRDLWQQRRMTVLMVTHNPELIAGSPRRLELKQGMLHAMA